MCACEGKANGVALWLVPGANRSLAASMGTAMAVGGEGRGLTYYSLEGSVETLALLQQLLPIGKTALQEVSSVRGTITASVRRGACRRYGDGTGRATRPLPSPQQQPCSCAELGGACELTLMCCVTFLNVSPKVEKSTAVMSTAMA